MPVDVDVLTRAAAHLKVLPARPWRATELTEVDLHGEPEWDPDVQPSADAHAREVERARTMATWRGIVDADGTPLIGVPLPGGSAPQPVVHPIWRFVADAPDLLDGVLEQARTMWRTLQGRPAPPPDPSPPQILKVVTRGQLEQAARAAYQAVPDPGPSWDGLPEPAREQWRERTLAAVMTVMGGTGAPSGR